MKLPDLPAGVYRHYKGHLYQALGYASDSNDDQRIVVTYIGLELDDAHPGPRLHVRTAQSADPTVDAWWDSVHPDGSKCTHSSDCPQGPVKPRFEYLGPLWGEDAQ